MREIELVLGLARRVAELEARLGLPALMPVASAIMSAVQCAVSPGGSLSVSASAVRRIWKAHGLQPHRWRRFKLSRDPDFVAKLRDVVGLCQWTSSLTR
jgi:hypothetical protein